MGDVGDAFNEWRKCSKIKKAKNTVDSTALLDTHGIKYERKNGGVHLVVKHDESIFDFWPSTVKWIERGTRNYQRGVFKLLKALGKEKDNG